MIVVVLVSYMYECKHAFLSGSDRKGRWWYEYAGGLALYSGAFIFSIT